MSGPHIVGYGDLSRTSLFYLASLSTAKDQPHTDRASAFRLAQTMSISTEITKLFSS